MKFECGDLERALAHPELMPDARLHIKTCPTCRREFQLWLDISNVAKDLHHDWDTPALWPRIRQSLEAERKPPIRWWRNARLISAVAAALVLAVVSPIVWKTHSEKPVAQDPDFLTEQALVDVEKNEVAYRNSIDQLARLAKLKLENSSSPKAVNAQEKLLMLDAAISDTRHNVASNRFNLHLQSTLADLYREKQQTLKDLLTNDQNN